ncbi:MAG: glutamate--tRNA ligase, partial [Candidatus Dojkabacteria bacterium]|nr:glutamate--tRNA ligase [Candidatus Dojkabacteria bacterium]
FDEGPVIGGPHVPYIQSERLDIYHKKAEELVNGGYAYYCFCSQERLDEVRKKQQEEKKQPMYDKKCRHLDIAESRERIKKGEKYVIRLKVPKNRRLEIEDQILGRIKWDSNIVDDQVLIKSDGFPTYHLAVVVDDVIMGITHITRGFEWLASVPKHILLFDAFNYKIPIMAHMPLILDPDGGKLSKRKGSVSTEEFLAHGYLPEALLNFIMLLGWAPKDDREIFSLTEFIREFSLDRMNKTNPVFNRQKLLWFNGEYIRRYSKKEFTKKVTDWVETHCEDEKMKKNILEDKDLQPKLELVQERISLLSDVLLSLKFFYEAMPIPDHKTIKGVKRYRFEDVKKAVAEYATIISRYDGDTSKWKHEVWEKDVRTVADKFDLKHGDMFMMIRIVICGSPVSPPLFESLLILGKEEVIARLEKFL